MSIKNFSAYSIEGGLLSIDDILDQDFVKKSGKAFLTDLNTLSGAPEFFEKCEAKNIQPIIGVTVTINDEHERIGNVTLYAKNKNGYDNLKKIVSTIVKTDDKEKYTSFEHVINNSEDLIISTGGYDSILYNSIKEKNQDRMVKHVYAIRKSFGDNFFFDIQVNDDPDNERINKSIVNLGTKNNVDLIASNNNRMKTKGMYPLFLEKARISRGINNKKNVLNSTFYRETDYLKTSEEAANDFKPYIESFKGLKSFLNSFEKYDLFVKIPEIPEFPGINNDEYLFEVISEKYKEFIKKIPEDKRQKYHERLRDEVNLVREMGFAKYFVIFLEIEKNRIEGQRFNLRGSAASFLITHVLGLSDVDPVEHNLLSERFLNKNRLIRHELPDIDLESNNIDAVARFLVNKYGVYNTAYLSSHSNPSAKPQIEMAKNTLMDDINENPLDKNGNKRVFPKEAFDALLKYTMGVYGYKDLSFDEIISDNSYINRKSAAWGFNIKGNWNDYNFKNEYNKVKNIRALVNTYPEVQNVIKYVRNLNPAIMGQDVAHASLVVSNEPISNTFSTHFVDKDINGTKKDVKLAVEAGKKYAEKLGFIKLDILSNKYLRKLNNAYEHLGLDWNEDGSYGESYSNPEVYKMISSGRTETLNQIKSFKQRELAARVGVDNFKELVAFLALIRPGVGQEAIDKYIENKNKSHVEYSHPVFEEILSPSHGVLIFEEQIMEIAQKIGGLSKEESDDFRSLIKKANSDSNKGKANPKLDSMKEMFINGARTKMNMPENVVQEAMNILNDVGGYTFSKAHSLSYGALTYKQTLIDSTFPAEYIQFFLLDEKGVSIDDKDEFKEYLDKTISTGRVFLHADINRSVSDFKTRRKGDVKYIDPSLAYITKNRDFADLVVACRGNKKYDNLFDFVERTLFEFTGEDMFSGKWIDGEVKQVEPYKNLVRSLIKSGALDSIAPEELKSKGVNYVRTSMVSSLEQAVRLATNPFNPEDFIYDMPNEPLSMENIKKDEELVLNYSPTKMRELLLEKKQKEEVKNDASSETKQRTRRKP